MGHSGRRVGAVRTSWLLLAAGSGLWLAACAGRGERTEGPAIEASPRVGCEQHHAALASAGPLTPDEFNALPPMYQEMIARHATTRPKSMAPVIACFAEDTPNEVINAFNKAIFWENQQDPQQNFVADGRWSGTALDPGGTAPGSPIRITWSVVPDGTAVSGFIGEPASPSDLRAFLDGIYGSQAVWLPILQQTFDRWEAISGIDYVYEANDDGVALESAPGVAGVRGDVRLSGHFINGPGGVLAYNFFPDGGDMVLDTADTFYSDLSNNSLGLRNVLTHEFGHGLGMPHVCPVEQARLMEPFVSRAFDGPRHDDIRHAQFLYGDNDEPNNTSGTATFLGNGGVCTTVSRGDVPEPATEFFGNLFFSSLLGVSQGGDADWYRINTTAARFLDVKITAVGLPYDSSPQANGCPLSASCCSGNIINTQAEVPLRLRVIASDGTTVLATDPGTPGVGAELNDVLLFPLGNYYIVVDDPSASGQSQLYTLEFSTKRGFVNVAVLDDGEREIAAGSAPTLRAQITSGSQSVDPNGVTVTYRINNGAPAVTPMVSQGGGIFKATLPALTCGQTVHYRIDALTISGAMVSEPCSGENLVHVGAVDTVLDDAFESDLGWTVTADAVTGNWVRVNPVGSAAQPGVDNSRVGTFCYVTGQGAFGGSIGAEDLDNGTTTLTSPVLNLAGRSDATISYARWYSNGQGAGPFNDTFIVEVSVDGVNWVTAETVGPGNAQDDNTNGGWRQASFRLSAIGLTPSANTQVRFSASDLSPQSAVEAAVDDVRVVAFGCNPVAPTCFVDFNNDGFLNQEDLGGFLTTFLNESIPPGPSGTSTAPCLGAPAPYDTLGYAADFNRDCNFDQEDLSGFVTEYFSESENPVNCIPG